MIEHLHWLRPLWLLTLLPLAWLLWRYWHRQQQGGAWQSVCDAHLLPHLLVGAERRAARTPLLLLGVAGLLVIVALAGPVWSKLPQPVYRNSAATVVLLSLAETMNAPDVTPTRLERAKLKLLDFLHRQREGQTALVAYSGEAYVVSPLTDDAETIAALVTPLNSELMPVSGNLLSDALQKADELLDQDGVHKGGRILLITDSAGDSESLPRIVALRGKGRVLSVLAVGTGQGAPIAASDGGFIKDSSGAIVIPTLNRAALEQLATAGQGHLVMLSTTDDDLNHLWPVQQSTLLDPRHKGEEHVADVWREEGPWLLLAALPLLALVWRRGWLMMIALVVLIQPPPAQAFAWRDLWARPDQQAYTALQHGDAKTAAHLFKDPRWQGVAQYRAGDYAAAAAGFGGAHSAEDLYNQGNALAHAGKLEAAAQAYRQALQLQPAHVDAQYNLKIVEDLLKQQQQQKQSASQQSQGKNDQRQPQKSQQSQAQSGKDQSQQQPQAQSGQGGSQAQPSQQQQREQPGKSPQQQAAQDKDGQSGQAQQQKSGNAGDRQAQQDTADAHAGKQETAQQHAQRKAQDQAAAARAQTGKDDQAAQEKAQQAAVAGKQDKGKAQNPDKAAVAGDDTSPAKTESAQALEQWLRRIPDDPGGLLRRKFLLQHQQRTHESGDEGS